MKIWDTIFVQKEDSRHEIKISDRDDKNITWNIVNTINSNQNSNRNWILIAIPNKRDKIELIVQKLTEIWIKNIYFRPSERSIIRERNEKKLERLKKIAKEAIEQSRWRYIPQIQFTKDISNLIKWNNIIVFDKCENTNFPQTNDSNTIWIIWPEWWLTQNDYKTFWDNIKTVSLWDTVLRTETATIIAARNIINN